MSFCCSFFLKGKLENWLVLLLLLLLSLSIAIRTHTKRETILSSYRTECIARWLAGRVFVFICMFSIMFLFSLSIVVAVVSFIFFIHFTLLLLFLRRLFRFPFFFLLFICHANEWKQSEKCGLIMMMMAHKAHFNKWLRHLNQYPEAFLIELSHKCHDRIRLNMFTCPMMNNKKKWLFSVLLF